MPKSGKGKSQPETKAMDRRSRMLKLLSLACLGSMILVRPGAADGPSFDCAKATGFVEKLLCTDAELVAMDVKMAALYAQALKKAPAAAKKELRKEQRSWLKTRNACETYPEPRRNCVSYAYEQRISRLEELVSEYTDASTKPAATLTYRCDDGSTLVFSLLASDHARVARDDAQWTLPHVPSGSGAKYESGGILFWSKGDEATFEQDGKSTSCRVAGKESGQMPAKEAVSLATIAGTEWVLREWGRDESVPAKPEVTLLFTEGRFTGHSGCNRYFASVKEEHGTGQITVGPVGGTRMACPEPVMAVETRFLERLGRVKQFGFLGPRLTLSYEQDGDWNSMLFEKREGQSASEQ